MQYRGVMHMHSTHSYDGKVPLKELKQLLMERGVSFCCMTEHTDTLTPETAAAFVRECEALSDETFIFIPGFEVPYKQAHVLHIGATEFLGQTADAAQLSAWRRVAPLVILAHPVRNLFIVDDILLSVIDGVEVWNQQYEGKRAPRFRSLALLKTLSKQKPGLQATGGLDFHRREHFGTPFVELEAEGLTSEAILSAFKARQYQVVGDSVTLDAKGNFIIGGSLGTRLTSLLSIIIIVVGKTINKFLATFGLHVPRAIRAKV